MPTWWIPPEYVLGAVGFCIYLTIYSPALEFLWWLGLSSPRRPIWFIGIIRWREVKPRPAPSRGGENT